jgi:hypothetical protein
MQVQVNMVHVLIALLRQQSNLSCSDEMGGKKQAVLEQLLTEARETNSRISSLEQALRDQSNGSIAQQWNSWDDHDHEPSAPQKPSSVRSATVDAINQSVTERHGRSWRVSEFSGDNYIQMAASDLFWFHQGAERPFNGIVEKFNPSKSDFEQALVMPNKSYLKTSELLRQQAVRLDAIERNGDRFRLLLIAMGCLIFLALFAVLY